MQKIIAKKILKKKCKMPFDVEYEEKFEKWLSTETNGIVKVGIPTLREIFDAMDEEDK